MSLGKPEISVVMSVYNGEKYLRETILSILNQTVDNFEFIIINDCSTDGTLKILEEFEEHDARIIILNNEVNLKLPASLNRGIDVAKGNFIARMDADDIAFPERFEIQLNTMKDNPSLDFLGSRVECFYDNTNDGKAYADINSMEELHFNFISESLQLSDTEKLIASETYKTTRICHSTLFGKTTAFRELKYNEDVFAEDWDLYNRALNLNYSISKVPDFLVRYRIVNSGMCGQFNQQNQREIRKKINKLNNGILKDCINTRRYENAARFFWYHYVRFFLATLIIKVKIMLNKAIKRPIFLVMRLIYKSLSDESLIKLYRVLSFFDRKTPIGKIPLLNRAFFLSLLVLKNNEKVISFLKDDILSRKSVNIGVWTIEKKWAMGGLNTILKMIPTLIKENNVRIINYGLHSEELKRNFMSFLPNLLNVEESDLDGKIEIISASAYRNQVEDFNKNDTFIAGFWEPAEDFINFRKLNHFENDRFVYIIQDYEPSMLYRWGSEYIRSKATLEDKNYYPIFNNSIFVCGYMKEIGLIDNWFDEQLLHGEPCETFPLPVERMDKNNIKLVFYSRPTVDKNIYTIKISALRMFIDFVKENFPDKYNAMEIVGIGEDCDDVIHGDFRIKNVGKVEYTEYPDFLKSFNIGLSCIISPAFAYPCIEFPRSGLVTVVNKFENRDLSSFSQNIVSCDNSAESIFNSLVKTLDMIGDLDTRYESSYFELPGVGIDKATNEMASNMGI